MRASIIWLVHLHVAGGEGIGASALDASHVMVMILTYSLADGHGHHELLDDTVYLTCYASFPPKASPTAYKATIHRVGRHCAETHAPVSEVAEAQDDLATAWSRQGVFACCPVCECVASHGCSHQLEFTQHG